MPVPAIVEKEGWLEVKGDIELTEKELKELILECIKKSCEKSLPVYIECNLKLFPEDSDRYTLWVLSGKIQYNEVDLEFERHEEDTWKNLENLDWLKLKARPEKICDVEFDVEVDAYGIYDVRMRARQSVSKDELEKFLDEFVDSVTDDLFWPATRYLSIRFSIS